MKMKDDTEFNLPQQGKYALSAVVAVGPIVLKVSGNGGVTYTNMDSGSLAASIDKVIDIASGFKYKADIPAGDSLYLSPVDNGN